MGTPDLSPAGGAPPAYVESLSEGGGTGGGAGAPGGALVRGGVLRFGGYVAGVMLSVLAAAVLTRHLGVATFGQYTTVMSLVAVIAAVTDAGMSNIATREYAIRPEPDRSVLMRELLGLRVVITLIGVILVLAFALAAGYSSALTLGAVAAGLATVALVYQHTLSIPLTTDLRLGTLAALEFTRQTLLTGGLVLLVVLGAGVFGLLSVSLVANLVLIVPTALLIRGRLSIRPSLRTTAWPALLRVTVVFSLATAVGTIYVYTAQILTSLVTSRHQSGLFAVSFRVFIVAAAVPGLLVGAALPVLSRAAKDDRDRLAYALQRIFEISLIAGVGSALGISAGSGFIVSVIAGGRYAAATPVLQIQSLAMIASFVLAGWSFALLSLHLHRALLLANLAALLVSVLLTLVLASADGARGAAIAVLGGETTLAVFTLLTLIRHRPMYRPQLTVLVKTILAAIPAAAIAFAAPVPSLVRAILTLLAYGAVILATRALPSEIVELLPVRFRRARS